jgi:hypothetical protein
MPRQTRSQAAATTTTASLVDPFPDLIVHQRRRQKKKKKKTVVLRSPLAHAGHSAINGAAEASASSSSASAWVRSERWKHSHQGQLHARSTLEAPWLPDLYVLLAPTSTTQHRAAHTEAEQQDAELVEDSIDLFAPDLVSAPEIDDDTFVDSHQTAPRHSDVYRMLPGTPHLRAIGRVGRAERAAEEAIGGGSDGLAPSISPHARIREACMLACAVLHGGASSD